MGAGDVAKITLCLHLLIAALLNGADQSFVRRRIVFSVRPHEPSARPISLPM
jgi:hypothetical protein